MTLDCDNAYFLEADSQSMCRNTQCTLQECPARKTSTESNNDILNIISNKISLSKGQFVYHARENAKSIFIVNSGTFMSVLDSRDGHENVLDYHFSGEIVGIDGYVNKAYQWNLVSLSSASVCELNYSNIPDSTNDNTTLGNAISDTICKSLVRSHKVNMARNLRSAREKLGLFLYDMAIRISSSCEPGTKFSLPMRRNSIASYLCMTESTLSRQFGDLVHSGAISVKKNKVQLLNHFVRLTALECF